jgi:uncharacterized delta-60 repeat protein
MKTMRTAVWGVAAAALMFAGCGDDDSGGAPDATPTNPDAAPTPTPDAGTPDATPLPTYTPPVAVAVPLSTAGPDQLQAVVAAPGGGFYAAGYRADTLTGDKNVIVVKLTTAGALDTTWSGDGIASTGLVFIGGTDEIDIAIQQPGDKILVSASVAHAIQPPVTTPPTPPNEDAAVARLLSNGTVDDTFGDAGKFSLGLTPVSIAVGNGGSAGPRGLAVDRAGRIYVHAVELQTRPGKPATTDSDFAMIRLTADGDYDSTFAGDGKQLLDIRGRSSGSSEAITSLNATTKAVLVLNDGTIIGTGYTTNHLLAAGPSGVVYKLDTDGEFVVGFGTPGGVAAVPEGVFHTKVLGHQTEVYGAALHGDYLVTAGYGRDTHVEGGVNINHWVTTRIGTTTGRLDLTWGGSTNGGSVLSPSEMSSNCRNGVALPGGKTLLVGSTGPVAAMPARPETKSAAFAVLDAFGRPDVAYGAKAHLYPLGVPSPDGGDDQFWAAAVSGTTALVVGWRGAVAPASATNNDDAYVVAVPLQ